MRNACSCCNLSHKVQKEDDLPEVVLTKRLKFIGDGDMQAGVATLLQFTNTAAFAAGAICGLTAAVVVNMAVHSCQKHARRRKEKKAARAKAKKS